MGDFYTELGARIKQTRVGRGLSREKLSGMSQISDKFLYDIENGKKGLSAKTLHNIALALEVSADWLLDIDKKHNT